MPRRGKRGQITTVWKWVKNRYISSVSLSLTILQMFGLNKNTETIKLQKFNDIKYTVSCNMLEHNYKFLFADLCWLKYNLKNINKVIGWYIDKILERWWKEFQKKIKEEAKEEWYDNIYDFILKDFFFDLSWSKNLELKLPKLIFLNIDCDANIWLYDWLKNSWYIYFLNRNNVFLSQKYDGANIESIPFTRPHQLLTGFINKLFSRKGIEKKIGSEIAYFRIDECFNVKDINELNKDQKKIYWIYEDFCNLFNEKLLMNIFFNYESLRLSQSQEKLININIFWLIEELKNDINWLPNEIETDKVDNYEKIIEKSLTKHILKNKYISFSDTERPVIFWFETWATMPTQKCFISIRTKYIEYEISVDISSFKKISIKE